MNAEIGLCLFIYAFSFVILYRLVRKKTLKRLICHHFATVSNRVVQFFAKMFRNLSLIRKRQNLNIVIKYSLSGSW